MYSHLVTTYVGIDFEMANNHKASICAYGLAFADGAQEKQIIALHSTMATQEATRWHGISAEETANGHPFAELYSRLQKLPKDTVLVAHDLKVDRRALLAAFQVWGVPPLKLLWVDSLKVAQRSRGGKNVKAGVATMAEIFAMDITHHDPADDALVALEVIKRYGDSDQLCIVTD